MVDIVFTGGGGGNGGNGGGGGDCGCDVVASYGVHGA